MPYEGRSDVDWTSSRGRSRDRNRLAELRRGGAPIERARAGGAGLIGGVGQVQEGFEEVLEVVVGDELKMGVRSGLFELKTYGQEDYSGEWHGCGLRF